jgi:protein-tyrosine phosphatase
MRTSETDPIRVDFLAPADLGLPGRLGLTLAPGKKDPAAGWDRDLDSDLERLRNYYKVDRLVSLMEPYEYRLLKIADLSERASRHGIAVRRFPIPDLDAPPPASMTRFLALVKAILKDVDAGKTVVIHCRGGIGRSGLVAASCLAALGHPPTEAVGRVRSARPRAVEMPVQERWVEAVAERLESKPRFWWRRRTRRVTLSLAEVRGLVPVTDRELVPPPSLFWRPSRLHGQAHVARVLVHAFRLIEATGFTEETSRLWAAVYLHDIARRHDGVSARHGADAWSRLAELPDVRALFARGGVGDEDYPAIQAAVSGHSAGEPEPGHPHKHLICLLKDADGLDRVRLGDLDTSYLRHPEAREMADFAERLYRTTNGTIRPGLDYFGQLWPEVERLLAVRDG